LSRTDQVADQVLLRGADGTAVGSMDKQSAHEPPGHLHEAFSVLLYDDANDADEAHVLLQRRATTKYHFAGLWTNACCSHPSAAGDLVVQAVRRTLEELGVTVDLEVVGAFTYRAEDVLTGLVEHEHDTVLVGYVATGTRFAPDPSEVDAVRWVTPADLDAELEDRPAAFTPWLAQALECARAAGHPRRAV
jgi:isopentenyl-diphosphate delta-isomerase